MDLLSMFITVNIVLFALTLSYILYMSKYFGTFKKMGIPAPAPWPALGNLPEVAREGVFNFHRRLYSQYNAEPVYGYYDPGQPVLVLRDVNLIREVCVTNFNCFVNHRILSEEAPFGHILPYIKEYGQWKRVRNTISPAFTSVKLKRMSCHIKRSAQDLLAVLREACGDQREIELKDIISCYTMDVIAGAGFGVKIHSVKEKSNSFLKEARSLIQGGIRVAVFAILFPFLVTLLNKLRVRIVPSNPLKFFAKFVDTALERQQEQKKFISKNSNTFIEMISCPESDPPISGDMSDGNDKPSLTYMEIQGQALAFILAGFDSVSTTLSFTLFLLANHPECCQAAQQEVDIQLCGDYPDYNNVKHLPYLDMCINESLRMFPPGVFQDRVCNQDCVIQGFKIKKNQMVVIPVVGVHYDPAFWKEPETFDPSRFTPVNKSKRHPYAFIPFGQGPRNCVGQRLAMLTIKICLTSILQHLTPVSCTKSVYPVTVNSFPMGAKDGLWVKMIERVQ